MRVLLLVLLLAGCPAPEDSCVLHTAVAITDLQAARLVADGGILVSDNPECTCVRDQTVTPGPVDAPPGGYCAAPCDAGCLAGTRCSEVASMPLCLRVSPP